MSWLARKTVDLANALKQIYISRKYRALARQLGRPAAQAPPDGDGFIIVQIDGLSYIHLQQALAQGYMPHLRQTLKEEGLRLTPWRCGLPSTTPAVQAGILYGDNDDIPGFRWYQKENGASIVSKRPDQVHTLAQRLGRNGAGLLRGGSSYTNLFDGGASLAVFTVSVLGSTFFDNVRGVGFVLLFLLSPWRVLRSIGRSIYEYARDAARRVKAILGAGDYPPTGWSLSFLRVVLDVVFAEIQTSGVRLDIYRGVPAIYATYYSYDEAAHRYGPEHPEALRTLRAIDAHIHDINQMRRQARRRQYDIYILSDHGMSRAIPWEKHSGQTLGQFILDSIGQPLVLDELAGEEKQHAAQAQYALNELGALEARLSRRSAALVRRARRAIERRAPADPEFLALDLGRRGDIVVRPSGGLAHVYFNVAPRRLNLSEIAVIYPTLLNRLMEHPGIGLMVGREGGQEVAIIGRSGTRAHLNDQVKINGIDPLATLGKPETAARDVMRLAGFEHSGDLILFGAWQADGSVINFERQAGAHGGLGGPQDEPFLIMPAENSPAAPPGPIELHHYLAQKYHRE